MAAALLMTLGGILYVNPYSVLGFAYYLLIWHVLIFLFHRRDLGTFSFAFSINSGLIALYYVVQTYVYPETYGTSSPLGSWTDDSYFFSLVADSVPTGMQVREYYYLYSHEFSNVLKAVSLLPIHHPMDVIFFQSGTAALLSTFVRRFMLVNGNDLKSANAAYVLTIICPFLLMNGGALLLRDTFAAALFIYSLSCVSERKWLLAVLAIMTQLAIRPGTAIILLPAYFIIYLPNLRGLDAKKLAAFVFGLPVLVIIGVGLGANLIDSSIFLQYLDRISLDGREVIADLTADANANQIFLAIQNMPFVLKFSLNGIYMFLYPFFNPASAFVGQFFDTRAILLNLVVPIETLWLNAWFFAGAITKFKAIPQQRNVVVAIIVSLLILGTYSLQTRHKTIIYPIYYVIVAIGFARSTKAERRFGYIVSSALLASQIAINVR